MQSLRLSKETYIFKINFLKRHESESKPQKYLNWIITVIIVRLRIAASGETMFHHQGVGYGRGDGEWVSWADEGGSLRGGLSE